MLVSLKHEYKFLTAQSILTKNCQIEFDKRSMEHQKIKGYASVFNVLDAHNDIICPGAFKDSIVKHSFNKVKFLWQHMADEPIGVIDNLYEDNTGLVIVATVNIKTQRGQEVCSLISQGAISGLSIGFKVEEFTYNDLGQRLIQKANLWEVSIVTFPANEKALISSINLEESKDNLVSLNNQSFLKAFFTISNLNKSI